MKDMKFELNRLTDYSDEEIIREIQRVAEKLNISPLTIAAFNKESKVKIRTVQKRFNGWKEALEAAELGHLYSGQRVTKNMREQKTRNITDDELLNELRRVANVLGRKNISTREFNKHSNFAHATTYSNRFGSWQKAIELAGLEVKQSGATRSFSEHDFFENLLDVWAHFGRQPHYSEMNELPSQIKARNYHNNFGTWRKALLAFIDYMDQDTSPDEKEEVEKLSVQNVETPKKIQQEIITKDPKDSRNIPLGLRFKVLYRDDFKCVLCGNNPPASPGLVLHVDHIVPWSKKGETVLDNLRTLCADCNIGRGNRYTD